MRLPTEARILGICDTSVPALVGQARTQFVPSHPSVGQRDQYKSQGATQAPSATQIGYLVDQGQSSRNETSGTQGRVYSVTQQAKLVDQPNIQGTLLLSHFLIRVLLHSDASYSYLFVASCVKGFVLEVQT